jgi:hypothetical protein
MRRTLTCHAPPQHLAKLSVGTIGALALTFAVPASAAAQTTASAIVGRIPAGAAPLYAKRPDAFPGTCYFDVVCRGQDDPGQPVEDIPWVANAPVAVHCRYGEFYMITAPSTSLQPPGTIMWVGQDYVVAPAPVPECGIAELAGI